MWVKCNRSVLGQLFILINKQLGRTLTYHELYAFLEEALFIYTIIVTIFMIHLPQRLAFVFPRYTKDDEDRRNANRQRSFQLRKVMIE